MKCMVCGGPVAITPHLFPEADDRWDCLTCGTWGTISERRDETTAEENDDVETQDTP